MSNASDELLEALAATAESIGAPPLSRVAKEFMCRDLEQYPETSVLMALARVRREVKTQRLTLPDIIERIDDGRPGAEAAWSEVSGATEATTLVVTEEMQQALAAAAPLMPDDLVAARMAFIETYRRSILTARADGRAVTWRVSLGQDPAGRLPALRDAVEKRRISPADARALLPAHEAATIGLPEADARRMLAEGERRAAAVVKAVPMLGSDRVTPEQVRALADSIKPKRQPSPSVDWDATERLLAQRHGHEVPPAEERKRARLPPRVRRGAAITQAAGAQHEGRQGR